MASQMRKRPNREVAKPLGYDETESIGLTSVDGDEEQGLPMLEAEAPSRKATGSSQELQPCGQCGNSDPFKMRRYYSFTRLIGVCCAPCGQEWLSEQFLFDPDEDNTRPRVELGQVVLKKQLEVPLDKNPVFQVKDCRTKIENFHDLGHCLKKGDHITWHRPWVIWHHAIIIDIVDKNGIVKVMHWAKQNDTGIMEIMEEELDLRQQWGETFRIDYPEKINAVNTAELVVARAMSRKGDNGYNLFGDNCEAFATYCKTGMAESCQLTWLWNKLIEAVKYQLAKGGAEATVKVGVAEIVEKIAKGSNWIGVIAVLGLEGYACYRDLAEMYKKRTLGNISRNDFIQTASARVVEALLGAVLASLCGVGGQTFGVKVGANVGAFCGNIVLPGPGAAVGAAVGGFCFGFLGSVVAGTVGMVIGKAVGYLGGPHIGRYIAEMGTDDKAVMRIEDLKPGDHIVLHPEHHAIVVDRFPATAKIQVVYNLYQKGVVKELVYFNPTVYRLVYDERKCYPPEQVIQRAKSKIGANIYRYPLKRDNCNYFAGWCKMK